MKQNFAFVIESVNNQDSVIYVVRASNGSPFGYVNSLDDIPSFIKVILDEFNSTKKG